MIKRRNTIVRTYLPALNPIVAPRLDDERLTVENAAVDADVAHVPEAYRAAWYQFDNATGSARPSTETRSATTTITAPPSLPKGLGSYVEVEVSADSKDHPVWRRPIAAYFRREAAGWKLVGLERMPDNAPNTRKADRSAQKTTSQ